MMTRHQLFCLSLIMFLALTVGTASAKISEPQAPPPSGGRWLAFGEGIEPAQPELKLLGSDASVIELGADLPGCMAEEIQQDQTYTRLYGRGYSSSAPVGLPDLPVLRRDVEIPFGAVVTLEIISAEYSEYRLADLGLDPIYPAQPPRPKSTGASKETRFEINQAFYDSGSFTAGPEPEAPWGLALGEEYIVRGHRVQPVEIWPVAYDAAAGRVRLYREIIFRMRLSGSDMSLTRVQAERYASPAFESRLAHQLLNYNQGRPAVMFDSTTQAGYLIITADAYYDAMQPFVALQQSRGFAVTMTELSQIPATTNAQIKTYIQNAYDTWPTPPSYVLLVGDTNTMPGWSSVAAGEITDLYYATMDGSSDWHPDLGRGRFPVRSAAQTTLMVNKYLAYANLTGQEPWLKKIAFLATCDQYLVAEGTHNYVIDTYTAPKGYTGIFPSNPQLGGDRLYCITHSASATNIQTSLNDGRWAVIYSGHGGWTGWEMSYGQSQVQSLTSYGVFPFVASHACITGDFAQTEVFGETWVLQENKGALAFWGSSDSSYWDEDDVLERVAFDSLFAEGGDGADVSEMTYDGLSAVEQAYPSSARYYWETYNVLGDPSLRILSQNSGHLKGVVSDAVTGMPVSGANVQAALGSQTWSATTGANGLYQMAVLSGTYTVTAVAPSYMSAITTNVQVMTNQTTTLNIGLEITPTFTITGYVHDVYTGEPLSATVGIEGVSKPAVQTDPSSGYYTLTVQVPSGSYWLRAEAMHYAAQSRMLVLPGAPQQDFELEPICLLVVDDDGGMAYEDYYTSALDRLGKSYELVSTAPELEVLGRYQGVIWETGNQGADTLTAADQANLAAYLDGGGRLFLSGQDIGLDIGRSTFYRDYLHAAFHSDDTNMLSLTGLDFMNGLDVTIQGVGGANNQLSPSDVMPVQGGVPVYKYADPHLYGGVAYSDTYRTVYSSFGYEAINSQTRRDAVMSAALSYLSVCGEPQVPVAGFESGGPVELGDAIVFTNTTRGTAWMTYTWDFGDGTIFSYAANPSHIYAQSGSYPVRLTAINRYGQSVFSDTVTVQAAGIVISEPAMTTTLGAEETVTHTLAIHNVGDMDLPWSLTEQPPVEWLSESLTSGMVTALGSSDIMMTFDKAGLARGVYTTTLRIASGDPKPMHVNVPVTLTVTCGAASGVSFDFAPSVPVVGERVTFTGTVTADSGELPLSYVWDFGGNGIGGGQVVTHVFPMMAVARSYSINMTATNACGSWVTTSQILVVQPHKLYLPLVFK